MTPDVPSTRLLFFQDLHDPNKRELNWPLFSDRYTPVLRSWCQRHGVRQANLDDVVAAVVLRLFQGLPSFDPSKGRFRAWLKTIVHNAVRDHFRHLRRHPDHHAQGGSGVRELLEGVEAPEAAEALAREIDELLEDDQARAFEAARLRVQEHTWEAFRRCGYLGLPAADVAAELGMTTPAVYQAVYNVSNRIREEYQKRKATSEEPPPGDR